MERNITVVNQSTGFKKAFTSSNLITVAHLLAKFNEEGIDYENMTLHEGISNTILENPSSNLPTDTMFKGNPTNDLVIVLVRKNKKIESGANRSELYAEIKALGIQELIKNETGKHYTNVTSDILEFYIDITKAHTTDNHAVEVEEDVERVKKQTVTLSLKNVEELQEEINALKSIVLELLTTLSYEYSDIEDLLIDKEDFLKGLNTSKEVVREDIKGSNFSSDDINDILNNINKY